MNKQEFNAIPEKDRLNRVLEGVMYYAAVHKPNTSGVKKFNALPVFQVVLGLDEKNQKLAESYGLKVKQADKFIPMPHVKIVRKVKPGADLDKVKPIVMDATQKVVPPNILIGNGSTGFVKFGTYFYENNGGGVGTTFFKVQIMKLVPYVMSGDRDMAMDEEGFSIEDFSNTVEDTNEPVSENDGSVPFDADPVPASTGKATGAKVATDSKVFDD